MNLAQRLWLAGVFSSILFGQTQLRDVEGWGKIKWGMSLDDASRLYVIDRHEDNDLWAQFIGHPVEIGDLTMRVSFQAKHGSMQISRVHLWMYFGQNDSLRGSSAKDFDTLKTQLIQKYGPPIDGDTRAEDTDSIRTYLWTFPSTSIRLTLTESPKNSGRVDLDYIATDQKALDAL